MISRLSRFSVVLLALVLVMALTGFPTTTVYQAHQSNPVMSNSDGSGQQLSTVGTSQTYRVVSYAWTPATALNSWAFVEYAPGLYGYAPVQIGYVVYATVKYNVGVICCGSIP